MNLTDNQKKILSEIAPYVAKHVKNGHSISEAFQLAQTEYTSMLHELADQKTKRSRMAIVAMAHIVWNRHTLNGASDVINQCKHID